MDTHKRRDREPRQTTPKVFGIRQRFLEILGRFGKTPTRRTLPLIVIISYSGDGLGERPVLISTITTPAEKTSTLDVLAVSSAFISGAW